MTGMYERLLRRRLDESLSDTPAVLLVGPRRAGKTTLAKSLAVQGRAYITLDDSTALDAARSNPQGFIRDLDRAIIDEIQRAPGLLLAIKKSIDDDTRPGRFLLTGSANVMTLPQVADSLAGRIETLQMMPLARAEVVGGRATFIENLFGGSLRSPKSAVIGDDLIRIVASGGFPEALSRHSEQRRHDWGRAYIKSVLSRDLRDIAEVERMTDLPKFVRLLAAHSSRLVNYSELAGAIDINYKTAQRYVGLLENIFLVATLQPWFTNTIKRIIKTPKVHFLDTGMLCASRGVTVARLKEDTKLFGNILETFVFCEIARLMTGSTLRVMPYHFRDQEKHEVDIVLERDDGKVVGIEVKASASVENRDFAGLKVLSRACATDFVFGCVLYDGDEVVHFGDKLVAAPLSCLWG